MSNVILVIRIPYMLYTYAYMHIHCIHIINTYKHLLEVHNFRSMSTMHVITLVMANGSLYFVQGSSTKSEIRLGYGLLYKHRGQLPH